jgi:hypothetical protein
VAKAKKKSTKRAAVKRPAISATQAKKLEREIGKHDLGRVSDLILRSACPAVATLPRKPYTSKPPLGGSRFGGDPDLPRGIEWPGVSGEYFTFMAQIDLRKLPKGAPSILPKRGMLHVFMGSDDERQEVEHRVIHTTGRLRLSRVPAPPADQMRSEHHPRLDPCPMRFKNVVSLPGWHSEEYESLELDRGEDPGDGDRWLALQESYTEGSLLGYPYDVDLEPRSEVAILGLGGGLYDYKWQKKNRAKIFKRASEWTLLFAMGSNFDIGLCLWDAYTFQVLIRWDDLRAGRFDRTYACLSRC